MIPLANLFQVFPEGTETVIGDEDTQPLEEPIVAPAERKSFAAKDKSPVTTFDTECAILPPAHLEIIYFSTFAPAPHARFAGTWYR